MYKYMLFAGLWLYFLLYFSIECQATHNNWCESHPGRLECTGSGWLQAQNNELSFLSIFKLYLILDPLQAIAKSPYELQIGGAAETHGKADTTDRHLQYGDDDSVLQKEITGDSQPLALFLTASLSIN